MKKVSIVTVTLLLFIGVFLSGCSSINSPSTRQLMTIQTPASLAKLAAENVTSIKSDADVENLLFVHSQKMISWHSEYLDKEYESIVALKAENIKLKEELAALKNKQNTAAATSSQTENEKLKKELADLKNSQQNNKTTTTNTATTSKVVNEIPAHELHSRDFYCGYDGCLGFYDNDDTTSHHYSNSRGHCNGRNR